MITQTVGGRTYFAWLSGYRRFSRAYEFGVTTSDAMLYAALVHLSHAPSFSA